MILFGNKAEEKLELWGERSGEEMHQTAPVLEIDPVASVSKTRDFMGAFSTN